MKNKESIAFLIYLGVSILFFIVSLMVILTRGNPRWTAIKLKIGILLLSLNTFSCTNNSNGENIHSFQTCYMIVYDVSKEIKLDLDADIIYGSIKGYFYGIPSYNLLDKNNKIISKQNLVLNGYMFEDDYKEFYIKLEEIQANEKFQIFIYSCPVEKQEPQYIIHQQEFILKYE